jgi:hypothetical protein
MVEGPQVKKSLEYLAGLFDGEGSFSIQVTVADYKHGGRALHFAPKMSMTLQWNPGVIYALQEQFGGNVYHYKDGSLRWSLGSKTELLSAAAALLPHLEIKKPVALEFLRALTLFPVSLKGISRKRGERKWTVEAALTVAEIALTMNPASARKSKKNLDYLTVVRDVCLDPAGAPITPPNAEDLAALFTVMTAKAVAHKYGVTRDVVNSWCRTLGVTPPSRGSWTRAFWAQQRMPVE